jgi:hypothetical protein
MKRENAPICKLCASPTCVCEPAAVRPAGILGFDNPWADLDTEGDHSDSNDF